jgi:hypothetical protein
VRVKVTDNQVTSMVAIYLAYDRGYFTDEGLDVDLQVSNDRSQDVALLATNQVQFIVSLPDPVLFNAIARGIDIRVLASATVNGPTDRPATFLVRSDLLDSGQFKCPSDARPERGGRRALVHLLCRHVPQSRRARHRRRHSGDAALTRGQRRLPQQGHRRGLGGRAYRHLVERPGAGQDGRHDRRAGARLGGGRLGRGAPVRARPA